MATTSTPRLETMPAEIILAIAADDALQKSLYNLCLVSKRFNAILNRELYSAAVKKEIPEITAIAARDGNLDTLKLAAAHGADLNSAKWVSFPTWAADDGDDGNDGDDDGVPENHYPWATPLHLAAAEGQYEVVKWLVSQHVNLEEPGRLFCRCQSVAETYNSSTNNSTDLYLEDNEQVVQASRDMDASPFRHLSWPSGASHDVRHLLDLRQVWNKTSAIHCAAASGQQMILKCILDNGVDINTPDGVGANVLHYALNSSDVDTVAYVLAKGANLATPVTITKSGGDGEDTEVVVQNAVEWLYAKSFDEPFFVSDALDVLSQHRAPFWQWEGGSATASDTLNLRQFINTKDGLSADWISDPGQLGTLALKRVIRIQQDVSLPCYLSPSPSEAALQKLRWLLEHGADPLDRPARRNELIALLYYIKRVQKVDQKEWIRVEHIRYVMPYTLRNAPGIINVLRAHEGWGDNASVRGEVVAAYREFVGALSSLKAYAGEFISQHVNLPDEDRS